MENEVQVSDNPVVPIEDAQKPQSFEEAANAYLKNLETVVENPAPAAAPVEAPQTETPPATGTVTQETPKDVVSILKEMGVTQFDSPEKFAKSYVENRAWNTRVSQENATLKKTVEELQAKIQQPPQQQTQVETDEDYDPQDDINKFYENPKGFMDSYVQRLTESIKNELKKDITPVQERFAQQTAREAQDAATRKFFADVPEAQEFMPQMAELLQSDDSFLTMADPEAVYERLNDTLTYVKGKAYQKPPSTEDVVKQVLENDELFAKYIAGNETVKNKLLSQAVQQIQQNKTPPIVAAPGAAQVMPKPSDKPGTFEQLGDSIKRALGWG